jgi:hypothetical protein
LRVKVSRLDRSTATDIGKDGAPSKNLGIDRQIPAWTRTLFCPHLLANLFRIGIWPGQIKPALGTKHIAVKACDPLPPARSILPSTPLLHVAGQHASPDARGRKHADCGNNRSRDDCGHRSQQLPQGHPASLYAACIALGRAVSSLAALCCGLLLNPAKPSRAIRPRRVLTVRGMVPSVRAIDRVDCPSLASKKIRARNTSRCSLIGARARASSTARSSGVSRTSAALGSVEHSTYPETRSESATESMGAVSCLRVCQPPMATNPISRTSA